MKFRIVCFVCLIAFFSHDTNAGIVSSYIIIDTDISFNECISVAKNARLELFEESFGEIIDDDSYNYIVEGLQINVACETNRKLVIIFIATQKLNPIPFMTVFEKYFNKQKTKHNRQAK